MGTVSSGSRIDDIRYIKIGSTLVYFENVKTYQESLGKLLNYSESLFAMDYVDQPEPEFDATSPSAPYTFDPGQPQVVETSLEPSAPSEAWCSCTPKAPELRRYHGVFWVGCWSWGICCARVVRKIRVFRSFQSFQSFNVSTL